MKKIIKKIFFISVLLFLFFFGIENVLAAIACPSPPEVPVCEGNDLVVYDNLGDRCERMVVEDCDVYPPYTTRGCSGNDVVDIITYKIDKSMRMCANWKYSMCGS